MKAMLVGWLVILGASTLAQNSPSMPPGGGTPLAQLYAQLRELDIEPRKAITLATNKAGRISCTVRCSNEAQRIRVRDSLIQFAGAAQSTKEPPTVTAMLPSACSDRNSINQTASKTDTSSVGRSSTYAPSSVQLQL